MCGIWPSRVPRGFEMTEKRKLKRRVRARMKSTGETFTEALVQEKTRDPDIVALYEELDRPPKGDHKYLLPPLREPNEHILSDFERLLSNPKVSREEAMVTFCGHMLRAREANDTQTLAGLIWAFRIAGERFQPLPSLFYDVLEILEQPEEDFLANLRTLASPTVEAFFHEREVTEQERIVRTIEVEAANEEEMAYLRNLLDGLNLPEPSTESSGYPTEDWSSEHLLEDMWTLSLFSSEEPEDSTEEVPEKTVGEILQAHLEDEDKGVFVVGQLGVGSRFHFVANDETIQSEEKTCRGTLREEHQRPGNLLLRPVVSRKSIAELTADHVVALRREQDLRSIAFTMLATGEVEQPDLERISQIYALIEQQVSDEELHAHVLSVMNSE